MNKREKEILMECLYLSDWDRDFLVNVINRDLKELIPEKLFFCKENCIEKTREKNYYEIVYQINDYLQHHFKYLDYLMQDYPEDREEDLVDDLILNFMFCLTQENKKYKDVDIFKNKKSICYTEIPFIEILQTE